MQVVVLGVKKHSVTRYDRAIHSVPGGVDSVASTRSRARHEIAMIERWDQLIDSNV